MKLCLRRRVPWLLGALVVAGCPSDDASSGDTTTTGTADSTGGDTDPAAGGELLGCPGGCVMLLAAQTLDDRVEVFVPDDPDTAYRGAISIDLEPNACEGCGPGDNGDDRLDEPFGLARAGGFLHVLAGHYPTRQEGSLIAFPLSFFEGYAVESIVPVDDYFASPQFLDPVVGRSLGQLEPIFLLSHASGRLVVGVFNNDLFATEDTWTQPGRLLVIDPADPAGEVGEVTLEGLDNGPCWGASQVIDLGGGILAVACDGNEGVAVLDGSNLATGTVAEAAATLGTGAFCPIPGAMAGKRVRYLASDGAAGVLVGEGPTPLDLNASARLWHLGVDCGLLGNVSLSDMGSAGDWQLGEIVRLPAGVPTWLVAAGSAAPAGLRGVFVAHEGSGALELCPAPIAGFEAAWDDGDGGVLEPFALAVTSDGTHLAVGAGPFIADPAGVGRGKVLWASLSGADPCALSASVVDLTDGQSGHAPLPSADDPLTFRRGPNVVVIQELPGA
ncbi:MAG: hypothetical protein KDK70_01805 [Myxococcales bacterium]|nr:hypothetical protein [Myxococcales bacterium]